MQKSNDSIPSHGFTAIEFTTVLAIATMLAGLAVPCFTDLAQQIRLSVAADDLHQAMNLTRTEAIKNNNKAELIAVQEDWKKGWIVVGANHQTILTHDPLAKDLHIHARFSDGTQRIAFNGAGRTRSTASRDFPQFGHIQLTAGNHSRIILVNFLGHTRVCNPAKDRACAVSASQ